MKVWLFSLVVLLFASFASAEFIPIAGNITVAGEVFALTSAAEEAVVIQNDGLGKIIVPRNESIESGSFLITYDNSRNDQEEYLKKHNLTGVRGDFNITYEYNIIIEKISENIIVSSKLSSEEVFLRQAINKTIIIQNKGKKDVEGLVYEEEIPSYFLKKGKLMFKKGDNDFKTSTADQGNLFFKWQGDVDAGETITLLANVELAGTIPNVWNYSFEKGRITYTTEILNEQFDDRKSVKLIEPLEVECVYNIKNPKLGDKNELTLFLENKHETEDLEYEVSLIIPIEFETSQGDFTSSYKKDGIIRVEDEKNYSLPVQLLHMGEYDIRARFNYDVLNAPFVKEIQCPLSVEREELEGLLSISAKVSNETNGSFTISNPSPYTFQNVSVIISSRMFDDIRYVFTSISDASVVSKNFSFIKPISSIDVKRNITLTWGYQSPYGQQLSGEVEQEVTIKKTEFESNLDFEYSVNSSNETNTTTIGLDLTKDGLEDYSELVIVSEDANITYKLSEEELSELNENGAIHLDLEVNTPTRKEVSIDLDYRTSKQQFVFSKKVDTTTVFKTENTGGIGADYSHKAVRNTNVPRPTVNYEPTEKKKTLLSLNQVFFILGIFVVFFVIVIVKFTLMGKKRKKMHLEQTVNIKKPDFKIKKGTMVVYEVPKPSSDFKALEDFINNARRDKKDDAKIREELINEGWLPDLVDAYMRHV